MNDEKNVGLEHLASQISQYLGHDSWEDLWSERRYDELIDALLETMSQDILPHGVSRDEGNRTLNGLLSIFKKESVEPESKLLLAGQRDVKRLVILMKRMIRGFNAGDYDESGNESKVNKPGLTTELLEKYNGRRA